MLRCYHRQVSKSKVLTMDDQLADAETASRDDSSDNEDVVILDY